MRLTSYVCLEATENSDVGLNLAKQPNICCAVLFLMLYLSYIFFLVLPLKTDVIKLKRNISTRNEPSNNGDAGQPHDVVSCWVNFYVFLKS